MKKLLSIIFLIPIVHLSYSQDSFLETTQINTEIFCNHCLQCESCDENIFNQIKLNNNGIRFVKVDAKKNIISVKYNSKKTNLEEIEKAIAMAGYRANDIIPNEDAYKKLDGCCKK
jgi:copper chaperone CopZ